MRHQGRIHSARGRWLFLVLTLGPLGCMVAPRLPSPPTEIAYRPLADPGLPQEQYTTVDPTVLQNLRQAIRRELIRTSKDSAKKETEPLNVLALSGGGMNGAFDVGVLHGWTASGHRPRFDVVTGISTGAFIATFAFLGSQYDPVLKDAYVHVSADDVYTKHSLVSILWSDALNSAEPLRHKIEAAITPKVLHAVAQAHAAGRRLYIGTTNLDSRSLVVWDMGAIASAGKPESLRSTARSCSPRPRCRSSFRPSILTWK